MRPGGSSASHEGGGGAGFTAWVWTIAVLAVMILGGGPSTVPLPRLAIETLASIMAVAALGSARSIYPKTPAAEDALAAGMAILMAIYLIPLPGAIWSDLPGRELPAAIDKGVFGALRWRPLSIDPEATVKSLVSLLPFLAGFVAMRLSGPSRRDALLSGVVLAFWGAVVLALFQVVMPDNHWLQFYPRGDYEFPIGFFVNHNHQAAFVLAALPLVALRDGTEHGFGASLRGSRHNLPRTPLFLTILLAAIVCIGSGSRTGAVLMPLSILLTVWSVGGVGKKRETTAHGRDAGRSRPLLTVLLLVSVVVLVALTPVAGMLSAPFLRPDMAGDERWRFWPEVIRTAARFWPVGAGPGTFVVSYATFEPLHGISPRYLNHAHDEVLQVMVEFGAPGLTLLTIAGWRIIRVLVPQLRSANFDSTTRASASSVLLVALHSLVEYPARTGAVGLLLGLGWALVARTSSHPLKTKLRMTKAGNDFS